MTRYRLNKKLLTGKNEKTIIRSVKNDASKLHLIEAKGYSSFIKIGASYMCLIAIIATDMQLQYTRRKENTWIRK